jgi:hypothetical protein
MIGSWNTFDYQIAYNFGKAEELTTETPRPGYARDGKNWLARRLFLLVETEEVLVGGDTRRTQD